MVNNKSILITFMSILIGIGCIPRSDFKHFTLYGKTTIIKESLQLDGVYACRRSETYEGSTYHYYDIFVLYENGYCLNLGNPRYDTTLMEDDQVNQYVQSITSNERNRLSIKNSSVTYWGKYQIKNDSIIIQDFVHCNRPWIYVVREWKGHIINDSTLVINSLSFCANCDWEDAFRKKEKYDNLNKVYRFFKTTDKPDSTNLFITNQKLKRRIERVLRKKKS